MKLKAVRKLICKQKNPLSDIRKQILKFRSTTFAECMDVRLQITPGWIPYLFHSILEKSPQLLLFLKVQSLRPKRAFNSDAMSLNMEPDTNVHGKAQFE